MKRILSLIILALPLALMAQAPAEAGTNAGDSARASIQPTAIDLELLEWSLGWLDTTECTRTKDTTTLPDDVYKARLASLPNVIEMPYNSIVRKFIDSYVKKRPRQVAAMKRLGEYYFPLFEDKLGAYGLPTELKYLPVIESALNASARSHAGAAGLWQFMPSSARAYGLEVNSLIDERLDPYRSTDAACRMLRSLYKVFGDWNLVIAAYNCGPGNVNKAIKRAGGKTDFWDIYPFLPSETRAYLPIFIAANYAMFYSEEHGICPDVLYDGVKLKQKDQLMPMRVDTIHTTDRQSLQQISGVLGAPIEELRRLNPEYIMDIVPGSKSYTIVLPIEYMEAYMAQKDSILTFNAATLIPQREANVADASASSGTTSSGGVIYYKIKKGDTLGAIAKKYHVTVKQLQSWNGLKNTTITVGKTLKIKK